MTIQPSNVTEKFPKFAIIIKGNYHAYTEKTCHVFVNRAGVPFKSRDQKYLASQGNT